MDPTGRSSTPPELFSLGFRSRGTVRILMALGIYRIDGPNPVSFMLPAVAMSPSAGVFEELFFRGVLVRTVEEWFGFVHLLWNYTRSAVFSGIVSGGDTDPGLINPTIVGPDVLTGGSFGLESSLIAFLLCTSTGVVMLVMA